MNTTILSESTKRIYVSPTAEIVALDMDGCMLETVSLGIASDEDATTGGDAKGSVFEAEPDYPREWLWEDMP